MRKYDPISHLYAVQTALHEELRQTQPNEAAIATCALFMAAATRPARAMQGLKDRRIRDD